MIKPFLPVTHLGHWEWLPVAQVCDWEERLTPPRESTTRLTPPDCQHKKLVSIIKQ